MRHVTPFHRSASVLELGVKGLEAPTAVQDTAEVQATPNRAPPPAEGLGVAWMRQRVPFQCSAKVPEFEPPTAVHAATDAHATLLRKPPPAWGMGVA
jgi:hypothetical protein